MYRYTGLAASLLLVGCAASERKEPAGTTPSDTTGSETTDPETDTDTIPESTLGTWNGEISWTVDFVDPTNVDCTYTRSYSGLEDASAPWNCPTCEQLFYADVEMVASRDDCYARISSGAPAPQEWVGYADGLWYRAGSLYETATLDGTLLTIDVRIGSEVTGSNFGFDIAGTISLGETAGNPREGYTPPDSYACGWPKADPPPCTGDYLLEIGGTVPDGVFLDVCEEPVRLHDFAGSYLLIDVAAMDCNPCQEAAAAEEAFVEKMASQGVELHLVTLLVPSLNDTGGTPSTRELTRWIDTFGLTSPVLADRGWGESVVGLMLGDTFGYPSFVLVAPDLTVLMVDAGYTTFNTYERVILEHLGR